MTSNGVTAALPHAAEEANLIIRSRYRENLPVLARAMYNTRVADIGKFFNCGIENVLYEESSAIALALSQLALSTRSQPGL